MTTKANKKVLTKFQVNMRAEKHAMEQLNAGFAKCKAKNSINPYLVRCPRTGEYVLREGGASLGGLKTRYVSCREARDHLLPKLKLL